jgi:WW domain/NAD:arginine ADP-ribosyltransferase
MAGTASVAVRVSDVEEEDGRMRSPLAGMFPASRPVPTSLLDAFAPFREANEALGPAADSGQDEHPCGVDSLPTIDRLVAMSDAHAQSLADKYPQLTEAMRAAVVLYTLEEIPRERSPYCALNAALRSQNRTVVKPWGEFMWLLLHAMARLEPYQGDLVFRGCKTPLADLGRDFASGGTFQFAGFSSTTTTVAAMNTFLGSAGDRTMWNLSLRSDVARDIMGFSLYPGENEVLLPPNCRFKVESTFDAGSGLVILQCTQLPFLDQLLEFAGSDTTALSQTFPKTESPQVQGNLQPNAASLPPGWSSSTDPRTGRVYFLNHATKQTTFDDPRLAVNMSTAMVPPNMAALPGGQSGGESASQKTPQKEESSSSEEEVSFYDNNLDDGVIFDGKGSGGKHYRITTNYIEVEKGRFKRSISNLQLLRVKDVMFEKKTFGSDVITVVSTDVISPILKIVGIKNARDVFHKLRDAVAQIHSNAKLELDV